MSAIGFLLRFFTQPISILILFCNKTGSSTSDVNRGAGSVRIMAFGPSMRFRWMHRQMSAFRKVSRCSFSISIETVYDVIVSRTTNINWRWRLMMSAENAEPTTSGGSEVDYSITVLGVLRRAAHWWHVDEMCSIHLSISRAKRKRCITIFIWWHVGWSS